MNASTIINALNSEPKIKFLFKGIFPIEEELPEPNETSASIYVLYIDGEKHWVCIFAPNSNMCYFFDPAGKSFKHRKFVTKHLNKLFQRVICLTKPIQPPDSTSCGYYILHFLHNCTRTLQRPEDYYKLLSDSPKINEIKIVSYIRSHYPNTRLT